MTVSETFDSAPDQAPSRTWTTERVEALKNHLGAGLTCAQIACEIGVTRNAVIGKISRLGLAGPRRAAPGMPGQPAAPRIKRRVIVLRRILRTMQAEPPFSADAAAIECTARCSLLELANGNCRWPTGDPGAENFAFCGNPAVEGLSYCAGHARIAYRPPARRRA
ncbi:MAG: GcrA-like regulator [Rhizobiales bacterium]|nr:GcrA-like regulator [Hyphomicrobiales bacterium]